MTDISNGTYDQFFISLLALDAYNRGNFVNVQLNGGDGGLDFTNVGGAILRTDEFGEVVLGANVTALELTEYLGENNFALLDADQVGFNAVAYDWGDQTVISYRGTDFRTSFDDGQIIELFRDMAAGWLIGGGVVSGPSFDFGGLNINVANQAGYAELFYLQVTGQDIFSGTAADNVILTGHSLGGGLAGYIGALSGTLRHALFYFVLSFSPRDVR